MQAGAADAERGGSAVVDGDGRARCAGRMPRWRCSPRRPHPAVGLPGGTVGAGAHPVCAGLAVPVPGQRARARTGVLEFHLRAVGGDLHRHRAASRLGDEIRIGAPIGSASGRPRRRGRAAAADRRGYRAGAAAGGVGRGRPARTAPRRTTLVTPRPTPIDLYDHQRLLGLAAAAPWLTYLPTVRLGRWRGAGRHRRAGGVDRPDWRDADVLVCGSPAHGDRPPAPRSRRTGVPAAADLRRRVQHPALPAPGRSPAWEPTDEPLAPHRHPHTA